MLMFMLVLENFSIAYDRIVWTNQQTVFLGGDTMVSPTRCADGCKAIYHINRYLVCRLHICRLAGYPLNRFFVSCAIMSMRHTFDDGNVFIVILISAVVACHLANICRNIPCVFEV